MSDLKQTRAELRELLAKATPGELSYDHISGYIMEDPGDKTGEHIYGEIRGWGRLQYKPNAEQIQDARGELWAKSIKFLPALLDRLDELEREKPLLERDTLHVASAAILQDGLIYSVPKPGRHHNIIRLMADSGLPTPIVGDQGFLLSNGQFALRQAAETVARQCGQIQGDIIGSVLTSEDLW